MSGLQSDTSDFKIFSCAIQNWQVDLGAVGHQFGPSGPGRTENSGHDSKAQKLDGVQSPLKIALLWTRHYI